MHRLFTKKPPDKPPKSHDQECYQAFYKFIKLDYSPQKSTLPAAVNKFFFQKNSANARKSWRS